MPDLPAGTVTFLFTDIQGSTNLWQNHPHKMKVALRRHDAILHKAIEENNGWVFKTVGDAFCAAFHTAMDGLKAALAGQLAINADTWDLPRPVRVRMAVHTGEAEERNNDYYGPAVNRVARIESVGHGGQTLLSLVSVELVRDMLAEDVGLRDMGQHRLKDLTRPESVFMLTHPELPTKFPPLKSLDTHPHNLPVEPTALIGREKELAGIQHLLAREDVRVVTLFGAGGMGKTRLGLQAAAEAMELYDDGVFFVDLSSVVDPGLVLAAIARTHHIRESGQSPVADLVTDYLSRSKMLLVLDNFEQVIEAAVQVSQLLATCPGVQCLVTSREPLRLRGEKIFAVSPLELPDSERTRLPPLDRLRQFESIRLFIERATAVKKDFEINNDNAPAVAQICTHLDGIPLAIELAAARIGLLSPDSILLRLEHRFRFLTAGARDLPQRQRTLRTTIDWSYDLLDSEAKKLYRRLSVFSGGFTLDSAEIICCIDPRRRPNILDDIQSLLDKSLLLKEEGSSDKPRFVMLESIREYGHDRLGESDETDLIQRRHAHFFLGLAEEAELALHTAEVKGWLDRLEQEHDNIREAYRWFSLKRASQELLRLCTGVCYFWLMRGYLTEGRDRFQNASIIATAVPAALEARALVGAGILTRQQGEFDRAVELHRDAFRISGTQDDHKIRAQACEALGWTYYRLNKLQLARSCFLEGREIACKLNAALFRGMMDLGLGTLDWRDHKTESASKKLTESYRAFRSAGELRLTSQALCNLGLICRQAGEMKRAKRYYLKAVHLKREIGERPGLINVYLNIGDLDYKMANYGEAVSYYRKLLKVAKQNADCSMQSKACSSMAEALIALGRKNKALKFASEALRLAEEMGLQEAAEIGSGLWILGEAWLAHGNTTKARTYLKRGIPILKKAHFDEELVKAQKSLKVANAAVVGRDK